jgi:hypothetical protein
VSEGTEGTAVVTTEQIYTLCQDMGRTLVELKVRFEMVSDLKTRVEKIEDRMEQEQKNRWQLPVAWTAAVAAVAGDIYQAVQRK